MKKGPIEVKLYVKRQDCVIMNYIGSKTSIIEKIVPGEMITNHLIRGEFTKELRKDLNDKGVKLVNVGRERVWIRSPSCSSCRFLSQSYSLILDAVNLSKNEIVYKLIVPSLSILREILKEMNDMGLEPRILERRNVLEDENLQLTPRQLEVLILAYKRGYFEVDRKTSLSEISEMLGIAPSSAQEILRRALKKVVEEYIQKIKNS
jgi:predicted DNA binding protein